MTTNKERKTEIYIPLLNEGTDVCRPTFAEQIEENIFRVLPTQNYDPEDEEWEFLPGSIVRCEKQTREGKEILVANAHLCAGFLPSQE